MGGWEAALLMTAFQVGSSFYAADLEEDAADDYNDLVEQQKAAAAEQARLQDQQAAAEASEVDKQAKADTFSRRRAALRERAALRVGAAEGAVGGTSPTLQMLNAMMQEGLDISTLEANRTSKQKQLAKQRTTNRIGDRAQQLSLESAKRTTTDAGTAALLSLGSAVGTGLQTQAAWNSIKT